MKKKSALFLLSLALLLTIGCSKSDKRLNNDQQIKNANLSFTGCVNSTKSTTSEIPSIQVTKTENNYLKIQAFNTEFCCGTESISINESINRNQITVEIFDNGPLTFCYCPHNVDFLIGPLEEKEYSIVFIESINSYARDTILGSFEFTDGLNKSFN